MAAKKRASSKRKGPAYFVAKSPIHGRGLFAARDIPKNTLIESIEGVPTKRDGSYVIWSDDDRGNESGIRITNACRFVNHAKKPNAGFFGLELWSVRAIKKGDEITHNYGESWE